MNTDKSLIFPLLALLSLGSTLSISCMESEDEESLRKEIILLPIDRYMQEEHSPHPAELSPFEKRFLQLELGLIDSSSLRASSEENSRLLEEGNELDEKTVSAIKKYKIQLLEGALQQKLIPQDKVPEYRTLIDELQQKKAYKTVSRWVIALRSAGAIAFAGIPILLAVYNSTTIKKAYDAMAYCAKLGNVDWQSTSNVPELLLFLTGLCLWISMAGDLFHDHHLDQVKQYYGLEHIKYRLLQSQSNYGAPITIQLDGEIQINQERLHENLNNIKKSLETLDHKKFKEIITTLPREELIALVAPYTISRSGPPSVPDFLGLQGLIYESLEDRSCKINKRGFLGFCATFLPIVLGITLCIAAIYQANNFTDQQEDLYRKLGNAWNTTENGLASWYTCWTQHQDVIYSSNLIVPFYGSVMLAIFLPYMLIKKNCIQAPSDYGSEYHRNSSIMSEYNQLLERLKESSE